MKKLLPIFALLIVCLSLRLENSVLACKKPSAPPFSDSLYYQAAYDAEDDPAELRRALTSIISSSYVPFNYSCMWDLLEDIDQDPSNSSNVILIYSQNSFPKALRDSGQEPIAWNREHVWPKSHGFPEEKTYAYNDAHHLRACDKRINSRRSDKDFAVGGNLFCLIPYRESPCQLEAFETNSTFEVPDDNKGDVARMLFYMDVRYEGQSEREPDISLVDESTYRLSQPILGFLCTLYEWALRDPVSEWEKTRNDRTYRWHLNRNPFIDHPEWIEPIFGKACWK